MGTLPQTRGTLQLDGLAAPVEVVRDRWGIPHIRAQASADAFLAQGFVHAQDRFWHMEWDRRRAYGQTAELIGRSGLDADRLARRLQIERAAQADWQVLNAETRQMLERYTAGVNAFLETTPVPSVEFRLLGIRPDSWRPWDGLSIFKIRHVFMGVLHSKLWRLKMVMRLGWERASSLILPYREGQPLIVPPDTVYHRGVATWSAPDLEQAARLMPSAGGSNNWVVDGSITKSGKPLLAGDPHRALDVPNVYYQNHLACGEFDVIGVSFPGVPAFPHLGHNDRVAWAITNTGADYQDLYIERLDPHDAGRYEYKGSWLSAEVGRERIAVRGEADFTEVVRRTLHGPVIQDGPWPHHGLALRYTAFEPGRTFECFLPMMRARSAREVLEAQREWVDPAQNLVCADVDGNIAYLTRGRLPLRGRGDSQIAPTAGWLPVPGWSGEYEWQGFVPFEHMPKAENPPAHFIITANNKIVDDTYPYFVGADTSPGERAMRIHELIRPLAQATVDDCAAIQADRLSVAARRLVPLLLEAAAALPEGREAIRPHAPSSATSASQAIAPEANSTSGMRLRRADALAAARCEADGHASAPREPARRFALDLLRAWDYRLEPRSVPAAIYAVTRVALIRLLLEPLLGPELTYEMFSGARGASTLFGTVRSYLPDLIRAGDTRLLDPADPARASWPAAMRAALSTALDDLRARFGHDMNDWQWGRLHMTAPAHPLSVLPEVGSQLNPPPAAYGGDADTVQAAGFAPALDYNIVSTQVYRQIVDLGDLARSRWVVPLGASGHPGSPHYADQVEAWRTNGHIPMLYDWQEIAEQSERASAPEVLILEPGSR